MTRNEQRAAKITKLIQQAIDQLAKTLVNERAANAAKELRQQLNLALYASEDFAGENAPYTENELAEEV